MGIWGYSFCPKVRENYYVYNGDTTPQRVVFTIF